MNAATPPALPQVRELFARMQRRAAEAGVPLRPPPPEPTTCCGRGCNGCVWDGFYAAADWWMEDAQEALCAAKAAAADQRK
ncbi:oxidoreductase-like domain-containing protein [Pseudacidovorax intermedius]|uniref:oxidoreductase-like domain-containing protein n=1 Tax=Pseudacidovorax intermedius TaxID=433924 RepID=UPI00034C966E|nr:oxidoreductase-like domain-containing protein [Pseudacidovorax intermedius]